MQLWAAISRQVLLVERSEVAHFVSCNRELMVPFSAFKSKVFWPCSNFLIKQNSLTSSLAVNYI